MIGLKNIEAVIGFIILLLVYVLSVTPAGCFRAWVAKKMGDDTAESLGYLTLNPLVHIDPIGVLVLFLFSDIIRVSFPGLPAGRKVPIYTGFGWGRHVPINALNVYGQKRWLKLAAIFFSDSFIHFCLPICAMIALKLTVMFSALSAGVASETITPTMLLAIQLYRAFVSLNVWLLIVEGIINAVMFGVLYFGRQAVYTTPHVYYMALLAPFIIIFLFGGALSLFIESAISFIGNLIV